MDGLQLPGVAAMVIDSWNELPLTKDREFSTETYQIFKNAQEKISFFLTRTLQSREYKEVVYVSLENKGLNNTILIQRVLGHAVSW